jgi:hypothetical protein
MQGNAGRLKRPHRQEIAGLALGILLPVSRHQLCTAID